MADATDHRTFHAIEIARHPLYPALLPVPVICFIGTLLTDVAYVRSDGNFMWLNFSNWLVTVGLFVGAIAALIGLIDVFRSKRRQDRRAGWTYFALFMAAWLVELFNALIHQRDGWTAVVPAGLILSVVGVILILASGWLWQSARYAGARP